MGSQHRLRPHSHSSPPASHPSHPQALPRLHRPGCHAGSLPRLRVRSAAIRERLSPSLLRNLAKKSGSTRRCVTRSRRPSAPHAGRGDQMQAGETRDRGQVQRPEARTSLRPGQVRVSTHRLIIEYRYGVAKLSFPLISGLTDDRSTPLPRLRGSRALAASAAGLVL